LVIEGHIALRLKLVPLDWAIKGSCGLEHARAAGALLDKEPIRIAWGALCGGLETLGASHIDQWQRLVIIQGRISSRRLWRHGQDYRRCHQAREEREETASYLHGETSFRPVPNLRPPLTRIWM
jgi:hypothetical protein